MISVQNYPFSCLFSFPIETSNAETILIRAEGQERLITDGSTGTLSLSIPTLPVLFFPMETLWQLAFHLGTFEDINL